MGPESSDLRGLVIFSVIDLGREQGIAQGFHPAIVSSQTLAGAPAAPWRCLLGNAPAVAANEGKPFLFSGQDI